MPPSSAKLTWIRNIPGAKGALKPAKVTSSAELDDSEPLPTVSMRLPEPGDKPAPVAKSNRPPKPKVITFDERDEKKPKNTGVIKGDARVFKAEAMNAMRHLSNRALIRADEFSLEVLNACLDFQTYAKPKIKAIDDAKARAAELTGALVNGVLSIVGGEVAAKAAVKLGEVMGEKAAKAVAEKIADGLKDHLLNQVKSIGKDSHDLEGAVESIAQGFRFYASAVHKSVEANIVGYATHIEKKLDAGNLTTAELNAITPFIHMNDEALDTVLEQKFGIPGPGRAKELHLKIFSVMVKQFERIHLRAQSAMEHDSHGMNRAFVDAIGVAERETGKLAEQMRKHEKRK